MIFIKKCSSLLLFAICYPLLAIFTVGSLLSQEPPDTPKLLSPSDGETLKTTTPKFSWFSVSNAERYNVIIFWDPDCTEMLAESKPYPTKTEWTVPDGTLQKGKTYYWRVRAHNFDGWSKPSQARSFNIAEEKKGDCFQGRGRIDGFGFGLFLFRINEAAYDGHKARRNVEFPVGNNYAGRLVLRLRGQIFPVAVVNLFL